MASHRALDKQREGRDTKHSLEGGQSEAFHSKQVREDNRHVGVECEAVFPGRGNEVESLLSLRKQDMRELEEVLSSWRTEMQSGEGMLWRAAQGPPHRPFLESYGKLQPLKSHKKNKAIRQL